MLVQMVPPSEPGLSRLLVLLLASLSSNWYLMSPVKTASFGPIGGPAASSALLSSRLQQVMPVQAMKMGAALIRALAQVNLRLTKQRHSCFALCHLLLTLEQPGADIPMSCKGSVAFGAGVAQCCGSKVPTG